LPGDWEAAALQSVAGLATLEAQLRCDTARSDWMKAEDDVIDVVSHSPLRSLSEFTTQLAPLCSRCRWKREGSSDNPRNRRHHEWRTIVSQDDLPFPKLR